MLPIVADLLPKMLPFKLLTSNDVTDVTAFPTSYINDVQPSSSRSAPFREVFPKAATIFHCESVSAHRSLGDGGSRFTTFHVATQAWSKLLKATQGKKHNHFFILPLRQRARESEECRGDECPAGKCSLL